MGKHVARVERDLINHVDITRNTGRRPSAMIYTYTRVRCRCTGEMRGSSAGSCSPQGSRIRVNFPTIRHRVIPTTLVISESVKSVLVCRLRRARARSPTFQGSARSSAWTTITQLLSSRRGSSLRGRKRACALFRYSLIYPGAPRDATFLIYKTHVLYISAFQATASR